MIAVMGATGRTGRRITDLLLKAGEKVRALARSESRLSELKGAEGLAGEATDAAFRFRVEVANLWIHHMLAQPPPPEWKAVDETFGIRWGPVRGSEAGQAAAVGPPWPSPARALEASAGEDLTDG